MKLFDLRSNVCYINTLEAGLLEMGRSYINTLVMNSFNDLSGQQHIT